MNKTKNITKIYFTITFGLPFILGIFMGVAYVNEIDISIFPLVWMYLPAFGVMTAEYLAHGNEHPIPKVFYVTFSFFSIAMVILCMASVVFAHLNFAILINILAMVSCPICFIEILCMKKEKRKQYGLSFTVNLKRSIFGIALFILLYLLICLLGFVAENIFLGRAEGYAFKPDAPMYLAAMAINLLFSFTAFFGEEYGWRYFLQPILQKKFGLRRGVILLGLLWGIWHLPLNLFYYSPETSLQSILMQLAGCVGMGIFFGWVYMRTHNIWAVTIIHFINNNMGSALFDASPAGVVWDWQTTLISISLYLIVYMPFLLTKEYRGSSAGVNDETF